MEGYATALSLQATLRYLSRDAEVVVCYSSGNLAKCARRGVVIVDHDAHICPRAPYGCGARWSAAGVVPQRCPMCGGSKVVQAAGEKAAMATGLPYWMPPELREEVTWTTTLPERLLADDREPRRQVYEGKYGVSALAREIKDAPRCAKKRSD